MKEKQQNMTFTDYLAQLEKESRKTPKTEFRNQVCKSLGISKETFYYKKRNDSWTKLEQEYLSELTGIPVNIAFPKTEKVA
ncbi:MAG: hypothetical protein ACOCVA_03360 [Prolixibacteraceae bacterium]